jgi:CRISPR-associated protein Csd1
MILQALAEYYSALEKQGKTASPGWGPVKVSFALYLGEDGALERVVSVQAEQQRGKKTVLVPQNMSLPAPIKRTVGVAANFLCDNSSYILGVDTKGDPERTAKCFAACKALHQKLLTGIDTTAAKSALAFFQNWQPDKAAEHPALAEHWDELISGCNLVFRCADGYAQDDPEIRRAWERHYNSDDDGAPKMVCLITGELGPAVAVHPAIKGVAGAQSSGAALVSFNAPAFCSFGKEQNLNAPTSKSAAFAYTTALNHLLADRDHVFRIGDTTVIFWAQSGETAYQDLFGSVYSDAYEEEDLRHMVEELCKGHGVEFDDTMLEPSMKFYVLGLSPNSARLSVRFFLRNTFGEFLKHIEAHRARLKILRPNYAKYEVPSLKSLLDATVNQNSRDKQASPEMAGEMLRAILNDTPYPATLLNGVVLRMRAERAVTWPRAAILKAYYLKRPNKDIPAEEVLTVSLNEASTSVPYNLGRLFSVLENIQQKANPSINATIKDKYFNSASATPAVVFPVLINLAQKHLKKLPDRQRIYFEKSMQAVLDMLGEDFPTRLNLPQQGAFQLGYYHQTQVRYQNKEDK